jgi:hypothetical protein
MNNNFDVEQFVKEPTILVDLCREVIDAIGLRSNDPKTGEMGTQLREISRTIDRLDKAGVQIPEALRAEKTRLAAALGTKTETSQILICLIDAFEDLLKDLKKRLGQDENYTGGKEFYRDYIINALNKLGGRARPTDLFKEMKVQLADKLQPCDLESYPNGTEVWYMRASWERVAMVREGILRSDSPHGIWELNKDR